VRADRGASAVVRLLQALGITHRDAHLSSKENLGAKNLNLGCGRAVRCCTAVCRTEPHRAATSRMYRVYCDNYSYRDAAFTAVLPTLRRCRVDSSELSSPTRARVQASQCARLGIQLDVKSFATLFGGSSTRLTGSASCLRFLMALSANHNAAKLHECYVAVYDSIWSEQRLSLDKTRANSAAIR
jgi:hypothetical protein